MNRENDTIGVIGLQFFGKMTASISHEIKNVLAIINESAGILEDFTLMEKKGVPLNPEKVDNAAKRVLKQVQRADGIIKKMNTLAHTIDEPIASIDINEVVSLVVALSDRFASNKGVKLEPQPSENPITIQTNPFYLQNLIWQCLDFAMDASGEYKKVVLRTEGTENGVTIKFTKLKGLAEIPADKFPTDREMVLSKALKAELDTDIDAEEITISLSNLIEG
jgi:signal transduction histidine kinase